MLDGDFRIALDFNVLRGQDWIIKLTKQMFIFFVQKNKTIYYTNCLIQFVLPSRLQMSNQSFMCSPPKHEQDILLLICTSGEYLHE